MRKIIYLSILLIVAFNFNCYAAENVWNIAEKSVIEKNENIKIGKYYFDIVSEEYNGKEKNVLKYSEDGNAYSELCDIEICVYPQYENGLYFIVDTSLESVPENKRFAGFHNSPMYVLDSNLNIINKIEKNGFIKYYGFINDAHYMTVKSYVNSSSENNWEGEAVTSTYKSTDGIDWQMIEDDIFKYLSKGYRLYNGNIYYKPYGTDSRFLINDGKEYEILREYKNFIGIWTADERMHLYKICIVEDEAEALEKNYLTMDCLYGVEMPDDIGEYLFEKDDCFYFEKDNESYYYINKSELIDNVSVIYNNKILAFTTPPTIEDGSTLVPMRFLFEQMGADVSWDNETRTAEVSKEGEIISFSIDNTEASVNGSLKTMDVPARLINDKTMIPIRFLSENLGYTVSWDGDSRMVTITAE